MQTLADAVVGQDLDGRITLWNAAAEQLFGYPASEAMGDPPPTCCYPWTRSPTMTRYVHV